MQAAAQHGAQAVHVQQLCSPAQATPARVKLLQQRLQHLAPADAQPRGELLQAAWLGLAALLLMEVVGVRDAMSERDV